ncbi:alpha/beta hydrolase [Leptospira gomenensis]|uniref:Alpha/beta hydrolase n=1 Tax=Leptospira gomenensis TaxID=2484974 RepID=A0A5F1YI56_9LEPT|nr:alpha/beta hydrolase [Leptospira gomenensis]TGK37521.1 alpha/beta hydrolase [Leptospira gomenensis]TGK39473.1 alpha/beta hydrolase [Leptospira gomenensis]TGK43105.1 alpha/beta hydrolase [Leptospira gomenensis]TGK55066.1 alpha/beta hydrolase [Leptospira gomenensis]
MNKAVPESVTKNITKSLHVPIEDGLTISAEVYGPLPVGKGSPPPILCIHGLTGNLMNFAPLARNLMRQGLTVIAYDLRGRGNSSKPETDYSHEVHAEDILKIIDHLNLSKVNLLAHSLGCWISLTFAKLYPERTEKLCLVDGGGKISVFRKLSNLRMIRTSLERLGRNFSSPEEYLQLAKNSPILGSWNEDVEAFLRYELEETTDQNGEKVYRCNIPLRVIRSELVNMGGEMKAEDIPLRFIKNPISSFRIFKKNKILPYRSITSPVLIIRAGKSNFKKGDELLPDSALSIFEKELNRPVFLTLPDKNHYETVLLPDLKRDETIVWFFKKKER